ncbi:hypothetical protein K3495_g714 [Podosphaera aphanis]|nr:hypothetical protein K3495_g714 [Podosphaera aphanis]
MADQKHTAGTTGREDIVYEDPHSESEVADDTELPEDTPLAVRNMLNLVGTTPSPSPSSRKNSPATKLATQGASLEIVGRWTDAMARELKLYVPPLDGNAETTNELTRVTKPDARYWKAAIRFGLNDTQQDHLRIEGVGIPYVKGQTYGQTYLYVALPRQLRDAFERRLGESCPVETRERSLSPSIIWWKTVNKVTDKSFGVVLRNGFVPKNIGHILNTTGKGVTVTANMKFYLKAATANNRPISAGVTRTVGVELIRAYITDVNVDIEPPERAASASTPAVALPTDVATEDLLGKLNAMGL